MKDWRAQLNTVKKQIKQQRTIRKPLPSYFNFKDHGAFNFDKALQYFDWNLKDCPVEIDFSTCRSTNYQALTLLILYLWHLKSNNCRVEFKGIATFGEGRASDVWKKMGGHGLFQVSFSENLNFITDEMKPLIAIRGQNDFRLAMKRASDYSNEFSIEYINTLKHVISELLYNTLEHGIAFFQDEKSWNKQIPSLIQFTWYKKRSELQFIIGDMGVGVRRHLAQTYPEITDDASALLKAIEPNVSGTFANTDPYKAKNNAGMGLFISSRIIRKLNADMHIISGDSVLHVSPTDLTTRTLQHPWPGTIALVTMRVEKDRTFDLDQMMTEFRKSALQEQEAKSSADNDNSFYVSINNYFGSYPVDKAAAISYRDNHLMPAVLAGKKITCDFADVESSPHSFLNALFASPIKNLGMESYRRFKFINAKSSIRETIDFILEDNVSGNSINFDV
ncbi:STAS-like domain-containing protein [Aquilutibacter rugosus]|uniref:STAS-like domain-containing protein n=1 Tax=Aquilutibacter rugosus TaxID=3115820 RepID=UPI002F40DC05